MGWELLGDVTIGANTVSAPVGGVTLKPGDDALWVRATMLSPSEPWEYSYGLLHWETAEGRELGTVKCHPHHEGETLRLAVGIAPLERTGQLFYTSRWWNRRWLSAMNTTLQMRFEVRTGTDSGAAVSGSFVDTAGVGLELLRVVFP